MPFARDTLTEIRSKVLADLSSRLPGSDPFVRRSALNVLGTVFAGLQYVQFGYLDWQARQDIPATAEDEFALAWGGLKGLGLKPATKAAGSASATGGTFGKTIPPSAEYTRSDGALYQVSLGATFDSFGNLTLQLAAETAGIGGDCDPGTVLTLTAPVEGAPLTATILTMEGGADVETIEEFRARYLTAFRAPPQGGDLADYVNWALAVSGVTRAWAAGPTVRGPGTVTVFFMLDDDSHANGIPIGTNGVSQFEPRDVAATGDQLILADYVMARRPVTALVYAQAPIATPLNLTLAEVPVDPTIRTAIAAALKGLLIREASPGGVTLNDLSAGGTLFLSHIESALAAVPGLDHFVLTAPAADISVASGHIATFGTITYS